MISRNILNYLYKLFPLSIAKKNHDYVGLMVGPLKEETSKILLCLDFDGELLPLLDTYKPDLIITHHPFIYGPSKKEVLSHDPVRKAWYDEIQKRGISLVSMHTNFDEGNGGMNDVLASKLELENIYSPSNAPVMRIGTLKDEMDIHQFVYYAKEKLNVSYGLLTHYGNDTIKSVGIIGGGGASFWKYALENDVDIYISGDAPHYVRRDVTNAHFNYFDVPHEVERVFMPRMEELLKKLDPTLDILVIDHEKEPLVINFDETND